jgi:hypothetical protein
MAGRHHHRLSSGILTVFSGYHAFSLPTRTRVATGRRGVNNRSKDNGGSDIGRVEILSNSSASTLS